MHVAIILGGSLLGVGLLLYLHHRLTSTTDKIVVTQTEIEEQSSDEGCCGMHITCERDSLSPVFSDIIEYFDDEELDVFTNRGANSYTPDEIECFRDVLLTLQPEEIAPWARSIQQRGIELPPEVRDELFIIVGEARAERLTTSLS
ncbi:MAG: phospholipase [Muribaculaceae bacterium]|nr:phospholipase [Muribaculaceae bacterium]